MLVEPNFNCMFSALSRAWTTGCCPGPSRTTTSPLCIYMSCADVDLPSSIVSSTDASNLLRFQFRFLVRKWIPADRITFSWPANVNLTRIAGTSIARCVPPIAVILLLSP